MRTFKNSINKTLVQAKDLNNCVANFLLGYRTSVHSTTGTSPAELLMGRKLKTRLDHIFVSNNENINQKKSDSVKKPRQFTLGQTVLVRDYRRDKPKWTKGTIVKELGPVSYRIQTLEGFVWKRHCDQMRIGSTTNIETAKSFIGNDDLALVPDFDIPPSMPTEPVNVNGPQPEEPAATDNPPTDNNVPSLSSRYPSRQQQRPQRLIEEC